MSASNPSIIDTRRDQIFPILDTTEIERTRRFGELRCFGAGEALATAGQVGEGFGSAPTRGSRSCRSRSAARSNREAAAS
jgi:hypothetical protein